MGAARPLLIEHKHAQRALRRLNLEPTGERPIVIGSSVMADLRLVGAGMSSIHAVLDQRNGDWFICDLGSTTGTWIAGESIVERRVSAPCTVQIGPHHLSIRFNKPVRDMFATSSEEHARLDLHQIVIKRGSKILETFLYPKNQPYKYFDGQQERSLTAPDSHDWTITRAGSQSVYQRLVPDQDRIGSQVFEVNGMDVKKPAAWSAGALALFVIAVVFWPGAPKDELKLKNTQELNPYQQLIFDTKLVKTKHEEAQKMMAQSSAHLDEHSTSVPPKDKRMNGGGPGSGGGGSGGEMGGGQLDGTKGTGGIGTQGMSGQGARLITSIRASGLNQLIGKIAKRNAKNVTQIGAGGLAVNPDQVASGSALAAIAGVQTSKGAKLDQVATISGVNLKDSNQSSGFRLGSVKTNGKGGGGTALGSGVGLAAGGIGKGSGLGNGAGYGGSGAQGLDDEAEVTGGLDKEIIAEIIKRDIGQIRYCYERQLSSTPELYGKVVVKFTIGTGGEVELPKVGASTLNNAMVEGCILRRAAKWKFPLPKGGMQVLVSYPFLFKALN